MRPIKYLVYGIIFPFTFLFCAQISCSQNIDSLKHILRVAKHDTVKCDALAWLAESAPDGEWEKYNEELLKLCEQKIKAHPPEINVYKVYLAMALNNKGIIYDHKGDIPKAVEYYQKGLKIQEEIGDKQGVATSYNNIGVVYGNQGDLRKAAEYYNKSLKIREEIGDNSGIAYSLANLAYVYNDQGDIPKALDYHAKSLQIREKIGDKQGIGHSLGYIGLIYHKQGELDKAMEYYIKSLKVRELIGDKRGIASMLENIGAIWEGKSDLVKAMEYYNRGLKIKEEIGSKEGMSFAYQNIGGIYYKQEQKEKALEYYFKSLKLREEIGNKHGITSSLHQIGNCYLIKKNYPKALEYAKQEMELSCEIGFPESIRNAAHQLNQVYMQTGNYRMAFENFELYIKMRDSINNTETKKATIKNQLKYDYEKQAVQDSIKNAEKIMQQDIIHEEAIKQQRLYTYGGGLGFGLMLIIAGISFRAYRNKQKVNLIINEQKELVKMQKLLVEEKQKEIVDSIFYARRIQRAMIANETYMHKNLNRLKK